MQSQAPWTGGLGPHPAPGDRLGRYALVELIGAGGLATVFRAVDEGGADVAVKVLNPARVLPEEVKRFTREYRALSKMDHPNVVRVFEAGVHQGYPWIAMEFVDGTDLDTEIDRWKSEDPRDRWERVDRILRGVCRALGYVHDLGLIHRDLKPSNVLLTRAGDAKVSDFGVVKSDNTHTTQLTMAGRLVGTVAFMAPELITDEGIDRRTDLYALGAVLYLMCTYRRPIEADSVAGYLARHLTEIPKPIGEIDPSAPPILERVCTRLLQKDRAYRYPTAKAVLQALDRPEGTDAPPLRGRDELLTRLTRHLLGLADGRGGIVGVIGPLGAGKSHLLATAIDQARSHGVKIATANGADRPLAALSAALDLEPWTFVADVGREPTILVVDDLDLAEPSDVVELGGAVRTRVGVAQAPVLLLFSASDAEGEIGGLVSAGSGPPCDVIELGPVDPKSVIAMLRDRGLTGPVAPLLSRRLHADYGGIPGPMMLQVEALEREGWLVRAADVLKPGRALDEFRRADLPVPAEIRARVIDRIDELDGASRELCELLAVLDRPAAPGLLERCRGDDPDTGRRIDGLVSQRILSSRIPRSTAGGWIADETQEEVQLADPCAARVIRSELPPDRSRTLHGAVAQALAARKRRANALEVARHLRASGDEGAAYPLYVQAARRAAREARFGEVLDICDAADEVRELGEGAVDPIERPRLRRWLHLLRGEALLARRAWDEAVEPLEAAAAAARDEGDPTSIARTLGSLGRAHYRAGRFADAEPLLREALSTAEHGAPERASALRALADIALRAGRLDEAESLWNDAMAAAVTIGSKDGEARGRRGLAHLRAIQGRMQDAVDLLGEADDLLNPDGDYRVRAGVLARAIELDTASGRLGSALYRAESLVELSRRHGMGERLPEAYALLADLLLRLGEPAEAEDAAQQSLVFAKATDNTGWDPRLRAARVLAELGRTHEAFAALPSTDDLGASPVYDPSAQFAAVSARLYAWTEPARARDLAAWALTRPPPLLLLTGTRIALDAAVALIDVGQPEAARNAVKRGLKLLGTADGADGIRLELLIAMQRASPDPRVLDAIRQVAEAMLPAVPATAVESFRARAEIRAALALS
ncbi:MAG: serine/threonine-protein kinase [Myxococcota bacterium]